MHYYPVLIFRTNYIGKIIYDCGYEGPGQVLYPGGSASSRWLWLSRLIHTLTLARTHTHTHRNTFSKTHNFLSLAHKHKHTHAHSLIRAHTYRQIELSSALVVIVTRSVFTYVKSVEDAAALRPRCDDVVWVVAGGFHGRRNGVGQAEPAARVGGDSEGHAVWNPDDARVACRTNPQHYTITWLQM